MVSTPSTVLLVAATAVLTAAFTSGLLWLLGRRLLRTRLERTLATAGDEVAEKVRRAILDAVDEALPHVRREVARALAEAGESILPKVREQVRSGVTDGVTSAVTGGAVAKAGGEIIRTSGSVIDAGLDLILGSRRRDGDDG